MRLAILTGAVVSLSAMGAAAQADVPAPLPPLFVAQPPINPITEFFHEIVVGSVLDQQPAPVAAPAVKAPPSAPVAQTSARGPSRR